MDYTELRDRLSRSNAEQAHAELAKLTKNELYKLSQDPAVSGYGALIMVEAASRYFRSTK